ncbi:MAG TPA: glycosyltransferase family 4 protein [Arachnia sp.]|nr:glycosyltransferase family 4 protein [Arachnia sp.]
MRICYLDHYAGSPTAGMEYRPHAMAVEWARLGVDTTIVAGTYSHLRTRNFPDAEPGRPYDVDGVEFRFLRTREYEGNGVGRILSWVDYVGGGLRAAGTMARELRPDAVISSSTYPFDTYFAQRLARLSGARLIHEVHDLWPLTPIELGGHSPRHPLMAAMGAAERSAYRHSDAIVSILPNIEPHVRSLGIDTPVIPIPNGIDAAATPDQAPEAFVRLIDGLRARGRRVLGYAGGMTTANAMDDLVAAMALLRDEPVTAVLVGDGLYRADLERQAKEVGADVVFFGSLPKAQVHDALTRCDALYIGSKRGALYEYGVSANKIFDYMLTGVPVVDAFDSDHSPLAYSGCAIPARAEDPADIARAIREAVALPEDERERRGAAGIAWVTEHHALPRLAAEFLAVLTDR